MISKLNVFSMIFSVVLLIAIPIIGFWHYRQEARRGTQMVASFIGFVTQLFLSVAILSLLVASIFGDLGFDALGNKALAALLQALMITVIMVCSMLVAFKWSERKGEPLVSYGTLIVGLVSLAALLFAFSMIPTILFSFIVNQGEMQSLVSTGVSEAMVLQQIKLLNETHFMSFIVPAMVYAMDIPLLGLVMKHLVKGMRQHDRRSYLTAGLMLFSYQAALALVAVVSTQWYVTLATSIFMLGLLFVVQSQLNSYE